MASGDPVAGITYLHTGGDLNRRSGGGHTFKLCTIFSYFRTSFSFSLWLGEWDHFTRRTETFQKISNMYSYFLYILHCMDFRWWGEGGEWRLQPVPRADRQHRVWNPPVCCDMCGQSAYWLLTIAGTETYTQWLCGQSSYRRPELSVPSPYIPR